MFQQATQATQSYSYGIDMQAQVALEDDQVNPLELRGLWINHLRYEQKQFDKEDAIRHPLTLEFKAWNFFGH